MNLEPTGERMILEHYKSSPEDYVIYLLHIATYDFAEQYTAGKRVLDYGCGSGYGAARIARNAAHVTAVDVAQDAVDYARSQHQADNLRFDRIDPTRPLPFADASFDTVLSFQVFEHVQDTSGYLSEIRRVLTPGGRLVLVTPDRSTRLLPLQKPWNRWHLKEYDSAGLRRRVERYFPSVETLHMSGRRDVIDIELRRCNRLRWLALPFTLPFIPDRARVAMLNAVHAVRDRGAKPTQALEFDFDESVISIGKDLSPSLNLIIVATKD
ncbi:class I SAM-dependent methyltransferase [Luteimonas sp. MJ250]|uniref:class I SAM-dependent methyltransferase n=1 Tax=Luteimonas sp. MJ250 TaxID=3129236 RepID=UPI0031B9C7D1